MMRYKQHINFLLLITVLMPLCLNNVQAQPISKANKLIKEIANPQSNPEWLNLKKSHYLKNEFALKKVMELYELNEKNAFINQKTETDDLGWTHHRLQQTYKNIPIEGANYMLHERNGLVEKSNGSLVKNINKSAIPTINDAEALQILLNRVAAKKYAWEVDDMESMLKKIKQDTKASYCPKGELVFVSPKFDNDPKNQKLAYKFDVFSIEPYDRNYYYIDANTGETITQLTRIHDVDHVGTAETNYYGTVNIKTTLSNGNYILREEERVNGIETYNSNNTWAHPFINFLDADNNWESNDTKTGCEAHWGSEKVYDYFKNEHNRTSFDGLGAVIQSWVHYGVDYVNAFWNGSYMTYGDGDGTTYGPLTCLDVVGHEITHAITERTAGLIYAYESGALNESFSDIFGTVIEFEAEPNAADKDWYMGEDANITGNGFRDMSNPNAKNHPDTYEGDFWYIGSGDYGGVHINSGVQNFWFYLLSEGGSGTNDKNDAYQVEGIDMDKAAKIAFRNLTVYLTQNSNYAAARLGSIEAAKDLYGANSDEVQQVKNAWCAVGVGPCTNTPPPSGQLTVTQPNGGEVWTAGNNHLVKWNKSGTTGNNVKIEYSINGGTTWQTIINSTANDGVKSWIVPNTITTVAKVRVSSRSNNAIFDESNAYFSIESPPPPPPSSCNAADLELGPDVYLPDGETIILNTGLDNMFLYIWDYQGISIGGTNAQAVNNTGLYIVAVVDSCDNIAIDSINVLTASDSVPNVWPGDTDFNGIVDLRDLEGIGLNVGEIGESRINQDINWYPHPSDDWSVSQVDGVNFKHLDTDGNGIIDRSDFIAIQTNYNATHNDAPITPPSLIDNTSPFQISLQPSVTPPGINGFEEMIVNVVLENTSQNDLAFYGGSFTVFYGGPPNSIRNVRLDFNNSWLGTEQELYYIAYNDSLNNKIDVGITRLDRANKIGSGTIAQLIFEVDQTCFANNDGLDLIVGDISMHNSESIRLPIATQSTNITFGNSDCPNNLVVNTNMVLNGTYQVANSISTSGSVNVSVGKNVLFKSYQAKLNPNFSVSTGGAFSIELDPCCFNIYPRNESDETGSEKAFEYLANKEELILNFNLQQASDLVFELIDFSGNPISKTDLGHFSQGKQQLSINKSDLVNGSFVGGLIYNGKRHYFIVNN